MHRLLYYIVKNPISMTYHYRDHTAVGEMDATFFALLLKKSVKSRDGTKPIPSTRSIGYRVNFKVSVSPINPIPIPSTFRYYFDTFPILYILVYYNNELRYNSNRTQYS